MVAALLMLGEQLPLIVDEIEAGQFDQDERGELARVLATIAAELHPELVIPIDLREPRAIDPGLPPTRSRISNSRP